MAESIGFPGRQEAIMRLDIAISGARVSGKRLLVALVNVDRFFRVNAAKGTDFGNRVLETVSKRLCGKTLKHANATVSKLEGNTFLVILHEDEGGLRQVEAVKYAVEQPIEDERAELYLTASIGAAYYPQDGLTSEQLICRTESALHRAKEQGGNRVFFYNPEDTERQNRKLSIECGLRPALYMQQFQLRYQPIYRLSDGRLRGFQTFIRWEHPELGELDTDEFLPIAEQNGLIVPIGEWMLREACRRLQALTPFGLRGLMMSVRLSALQLEDPSFPHVIQTLIQEHGLTPDAIELEVREPGRMQASETCLASLSRLRAAGVRTSIVDFGTGGASFHNLSQLPIHCVRIDPSFVRRIDLQGPEKHIVEAIVGLAHKLGVEVVADGVEYKEQYDMLKSWGCHYVQGHLLGRQMEPAMMETEALSSAVSKVN
ncbi:putative bifunctional diguanylate cyclase/phosphodiesterase [Paenibacillus soyae]|uniref:Bifunctional diguanylate cyclase/phosphodiesterase n=1 Tax=Paenibacillus soyae TaxID=2969249 RepID=A0A9X2MQW7_9BACL|nr:bifunctional diguanylate cyclase/phosphodiesterase [Paenibacillus soyae]MCR2804198.1 bifunctional diguanylate cyclase/phosphodiesterase [Paenibacillus soyae]